MTHLNIIMIGIYKIESPSGKIYIGQSTNIEKRFRSYKILNCKGQHKILNSLKKYGVENHIFEVIEECEDFELNNRERHYQEFYDCVEKGLNCKYNKSDSLPYKHSEKTKDKISKKMKGRIMTKEHKQNMSLSKLGKKRKPFTKEHLENIKLSRINKEIYHSEEFINNFKKRISKKVINIKTLEIFNSCTEARNTIGMNSSLFSKYLNNICFNKTDFMFLSEYKKINTGLE